MPIQIRCVVPCRNLEIVLQSPAFMCINVEKVGLFSMKLGKMQGGVREEQDEESKIAKL